MNKKYKEREIFQHKYLFLISLLALQWSVFIKHICVPPTLEEKKWQSPYSHNLDVGDFYNCKPPILLHTTSSTFDSSFIGYFMFLYTDFEEISNEIQFSNINKNAAPSMFFYNEVMLFFLNAISRMGQKLKNIRRFEYFLELLKQEKNCCPTNFFETKFLGLIPPFLLIKHRHSYHLHTVPVPLRLLNLGLGERFELFEYFRRIFFLSIQKVLLAELKVNKRKGDSRQDSLLAILFAYLDSPDQHAFTINLENYIEMGVDNRTNIHYRWKYQRAFSF